MSTCGRPRNPLVLVLGATGTGKSNLAIQIAQSLGESKSRHGFDGAEIINADAMQLYRGLPIITNKVSAEEQLGVRHHLLDHIDLEDEPWTVQEYVREADRAIQDIRSRGKLPVVVGGTNYYVHSLLFADATLESKEESEEGTPSVGKDARQQWPILDASTPEIYARLQEVDPEIARRWHPNDRRKIQRSLEIYLRSGQKASDVYRDQKQDGKVDGSDGVRPTSVLRYEPIVFWLEADDQVLKDRLNRRVDTMVDNGLLDEAKGMYKTMQEMQSKALPLDNSKGVWVSIGYKEMEPWAEAAAGHDPQPETLYRLQSACVEAVKAGTRQYAKRQNRYIRIRLADALASAGVIDQLFLLDCTDLVRWEENVQAPAARVLPSFLRGEGLPEPWSLSPLAKDMFARMASVGGPTERSAQRCDACDKVLMNEEEWVIHVNSRSHKRVLQGIRKRELNAAWLRGTAPSQNSTPG